MYQYTVLKITITRQKPPHPLAILLILLPEIAAEAGFFGADLHKHDGDENYEYKHRLPGPEPDATAYQIDEYAGEHRVATETVGTVGHQVFGARGDFVTESIHRVAVTHAAHIDDSPNA